MFKRMALFSALLTLSAVCAGAQTGEWKQLFNGKDLTGWKHVGPGGYKVKDGLLIPHGGMGLLWYTPGMIGHAVVRVVFKTETNASNSGVYIRIPKKPTEPWMPVNRGYEIQVDNTGDEFHRTGVVYSFTKAMAHPQKPAGEWNTMDITIEGPHTTVVLNGTKVTDYTEGQPQPPKVDDGEPDRGPRPEEGYIGIQNHSATDIVYYKEVAIQQLIH